MGMVFCKNSFIGELFGIFEFMGMIFRKFSRFMGGTFTIWMAQPRMLETQVTPPPPPGLSPNIKFCNLQL